MSEAFLLLFAFFTAAVATGVWVAIRRVEAFRRKVFSSQWPNKQRAEFDDTLTQSRQSLWILVLFLSVWSVLSCFLLEKWSSPQTARTLTDNPVAFDKNTIWLPPDWAAAQSEKRYKLIAYGRDLIARTSDYFGEYGLVRPNSTNGMNCQNCHLDAGSKPFGNNYVAVAATYPKVRARSGKSEGIEFRVNDCFMRSLNGQPLDSSSREMRAIVAYIRWLGSGVPPQESPKGAGLLEVPFLPRPADPAKGKIVFESKCASCHGADGQGLAMPDSPRSYPPLWGEKSYGEAAGLFRMSRFAGYVKANMPLGASYANPQLSDEEAWDVAAFVNSQPRPPHRFLDKDWPDISKKPFDHPFGPYADSFSKAQHKYGPFQPIVDFYKKK